MGWEYNLTRKFPALQGTYAGDYNPVSGPVEVFNADLRLSLR